MTEQKKKGTSGKSSSSNHSKNTSARSNSSKGRGKTPPPPVKTGSKVKDEIFSIIIIAIGIFLAVAIQTPAAGAFGEVLHDFFLGCFGFLAYVLPYYLILYGILLILNKTVHITGKSFLLMLTIFFMLSFLNSARFIEENFIITWSGCVELFNAGIAKENGGFVGMFLGTLISKAIGISGLIIFSVVIILICLLLVMDTPISQFIEKSKIKRAEKKQAAYERQLILEKEKEEQEKAKIVSNNNIGTQKSEKQKIEPPLAATPKDKLSETKIIIPNQSEELSEENNSLLEQTKKDIISVEKTTSTSDSIVNQARISQNQKNILKYMQDDNLFDDSGAVMSPLVDFDGSAKQNPIRTNAIEPVKKLSKADAQNAMLSKEEITAGMEAPLKPYQFPSIELLNKSRSDMKNSEHILQEKAMKLEETLKNFHVDARVVKVTQGPAVTRYEIQPAVGVKVASIVRLADDIALNLEAKSIRLEAPIPGKAAVGIEIENEKTNVVNLRDIIGSKEFKNAKSKISFAVGRDIAGNAVVGDLKSMPHMLIAGSTGSGKSVCINSIILSILYKAKPEEVKLVLIDPKVVELGNYNGIPHLLIPVVTEAGKAAAALNWAVAEMNDRYKKFAERGVRDLESYNETVMASDDKESFLPQIVIIIDELADLMMAAPSQVEESICRLAQMARAAGMHLIVATQRPSVDVVTGVIKANIPSRIAFAVSSQVDSRTIIDMGGAEKLVGKGDMLYNPLGSGKPTRVQGTFVSDSEVHKVIEFVKSQDVETEYSSDAIHSIEKVNAPSNSDDTDELLPEAIDLVVSSGQASVSMLQRRFRIGYNRAARIVDMMEVRGIIGPADGSRPRQVLINEEELARLKEGTADIDDMSDQIEM